MIEEAYNLYYNELLSYARKHIEANMAEDMVQEAFVDALQYDVLQIKAFLYRSIAMNIRNFLQTEVNRNLKLRKIRLNCRNEMPDARINYNETLATIKLILTTIKNGAAIEDVIFNKCTYAEAAKNHNTTIDVVKSALRRIRKVIKSRMVENEKYY